MSRHVVIDTTKLTRVTLVGDAGVIWERYDLGSVDLILQDDGRTLKVFAVTREHLQQPVLASDGWDHTDGQAAP